MFVTSVMFLWNWKRNSLHILGNISRLSRQGRLFELPELNNRLLSKINILFCFLDIKHTAMPDFA